jgi:hypothetical protein
MWGTHQRRSKAFGCHARNMAALVVSSRLLPGLGNGESEKRLLQPLTAAVVRRTEVAVGVHSQWPRVSSDRDERATSSPGPGVSPAVRIKGHVERTLDKTRLGGLPMPTRELLSIVDEEYFAAVADPLAHAATFLQEKNQPGNGFLLTRRAF